MRHRSILFLISSMVAAILALGAFDALIAVYVRDILASESQLFGAIISLVGVSTIVGSLLFGRYGQRQSKLRLVVLGILTYLVALMLVLIAFWRLIYTRGHQAATARAA
jgi:predicted MFS family arabinose efflux permease